MIGAGTLSERTRDTPPSFNEIRIEGGRFDVVLRTLGPEPDTVLPKEKAGGGYTIYFFPAEAGPSRNGRCNGAQRRPEPSRGRAPASAGERTKALLATTPPHRPARLTPPP